MVMVASAAPPALDPSELYIVRQGTSDMMPGWFHYVMIVKPDGRDVVVKLVRVAPLASCPNMVTVRGAEVRLRDTTIGNLINDNNPCAISADKVRHEILRHSRRNGVWDDAAFGIVAQCGGEQIVHHFPYGAMLDTKKLPPQVRRLRELSWDIQKSAFGDRNLFYKTSPEEGEKLQAGGGAMVDELRSGKFDRGFPYKASFVADLKDYVATGVGKTAELENAGSYRFLNYVPPLYPSQALDARMMGSVLLDVEVNADSGNVREVKVISGHPFFTPNAISAAKQWRFEPGSVPKTLQVTLAFTLLCISNVTVW